MATEAAVHKRNLESSILFMQQEHAATLKALHEEIQKLQKRCTGKVQSGAHVGCKSSNRGVCVWGGGAKGGIGREQKEALVGGKRGIDRRQKGALILIGETRRL